MTSPAKVILRLAIFSAIAAYVAGDLIIFKGPLRRALDYSLLGKPDVVARVGNHLITRNQLERAIRESLWLQGKYIDALRTEEKTKAREEALNELIDHAILRDKIAADTSSVPISDDEINARLRAMLSRFHNKGEMEKSMKGQGIANESDLRARVAARIQQEKWVEQKIESLIRVSDEEARAWFDQNAAVMATPERIEVRHIFMAAMDHPQTKIDAVLGAALQNLKSQRKDFATLAREISDDPASKERGGSLGWMSRFRLPNDFSAAVFDLPIRQPAIIRTRLGSHLVEVIARKAAEPANFDERKSEVIAALEAMKRQKAVTELRKDIRESAPEVIHH
jgi:parvulin-like peptidyl-prolyl isomerase